MVLPFVPVIATNLPFEKRYPVSISPVITAPAFLRLFTSAQSIGTPGLITAMSVSFISSSVRAPVEIFPL